MRGWQPTRCTRSTKPRETTAAARKAFSNALGSRWTRGVTQRSRAPASGQVSPQGVLHAPGTPVGTGQKSPFSYEAVIFQAVTKPLVALDPASCTKHDVGFDAPVVRPEPMGLCGRLKQTPRSSSCPFTKSHKLPCLKA